ncbi:F-box/WD repeat-containing protein 12 isoform X1 [Rattus rattus]|uniref:F-box/WD repeat-containing protein 12 isoform X1 n=1 Tax=Rattus rattus TaxID=10117 RepID=UPI0013F2F15A|nr:F-box/WD repeat-containing protein 12 isoform X1 [Rattus rattus]
MEFHLPSVPMRKILSYLDAFSLLQIAQVNKRWNTFASTDVLWRKFCLKRWFFYEVVTLELLGTESWKQFFVCRTRQERAKSRAKPEDFTYKEIPVEIGFLAGDPRNAHYISGCGLTRDGQGKSVICVATSVNTISTWDLHKGAVTWVSPVQPSYIKILATLPEMHIAVTVDIESTIKLWDCHNREALATNNMLSSCQSLKAVFTKDGPVVLAGDTSGNLLIFRIPDLHLISRVHVFQYGINELYCSPQKKWVFLNKKHVKILPKVFFMSSLLRTSEFSAPASTILSFPLCERAFWTPQREDRITLMSIKGSKKIATFATFDIKLEKEEIGNKIRVKEYAIANFSLKKFEDTLEWMGVSDKNMIVCSTGSSLLIYSITGLHLQIFPYGPGEILRLSVDPLHVIVTFIDGSLELFAWEERSPLLRRCYRLYNKRHMLYQRFANKTLCDDVSIVRVMTNVPSSSFLMVYTLNNGS